MLHYIQILLYCGEHKCSGFNALLGPFTLTVHSLRIPPLLLLSRRREEVGLVGLEGEVPWVSVAEAQPLGWHLEYQLWGGDS